ncbi:MAG: helix-turn-helix domain-containing protein [Lentisphaeria bacterium]|nr:helix-turn-helix domain-containing protein [Lentisphaeria bacterium]
MHQAILAYAGKDTLREKSPYHTHQINELIYILRGECYIHFDDDVTFHGYSGTVFEIPSSLGHERENISECETIYVIFEHEIQQQSTGAIFTDSCNDPLIRQWLKDILILNQNFEVEQASAILNAVLLRLHKIRLTQQQEKEIHPALKIACDYMTENCSNDITIGDVAKVACMSQSHLNLLFRQEFKIGPLKWLLQVRMRLARQLLMNPMFYVSDVATQCGFKDIYYFSKAFKNYHHITPTEYRENPKRFINRIN